MAQCKLTIDRFREEDLPEIHAIERDSFPVPWTENLLRQEIASSLARILVARLETAQGCCVAGYVIYWLVADEIHLQNIAVRSDLRRRGVGSRLLDKAMQESRRCGARWATLEVRRANLAAQELYGKHGFSVRGVRACYYTDTGDDALILWADLEAVWPAGTQTISPEENDGTKTDHHAR
jgi:ribosomal-protein-alanine N-acetyltransferase